MKYKITVIKYDTNPDYEAEMAKWKESKKEWMYRNEPISDEPSIKRAERSLEVFLTEDEYNEVKKAVLATFE